MARKKKPERTDRHAISFYADKHTYGLLQRFLKEVPSDQRGGIKETMVAALRMYLEARGITEPLEVEGE